MKTLRPGRKATAAVAAAAGRDSAAAPCALTADDVVPGESFLSLKEEEKEVNLHN